MNPEVFAEWWRRQGHKVMSYQEFFIRQLKAEDIDRAIVVHAAAFPDFFLTFLGQDFLKLLYRFYIAGDEEIALAGIYLGKLAGTLLGTTRPRQFYRRLANKYFWQFALASLWPFIKQPTILPRLMRALTYRGDYPPLDEGGALLASICVDIPLQNRGFGKYLLSSFEEEIFRRGCKFGYLITDRLNNDKTINFYKKNGWEETHAFTTPQGRQMLILCKFK
jgi:GNAT superfamily N-acetyltransferase